MWGYCLSRHLITVFSKHEIKWWHLTKWYVCVDAVKESLQTHKLDTQQKALNMDTNKTLCLKYSIITKTEACHSFDLFNSCLAKTHLEIVTWVWNSAFSLFFSHSTEINWAVVHFLSVFVTNRRPTRQGSPPARPTRLASPPTTSSPDTEWRWRNASASCSPSSPDLFCEGAAEEEAMDGWMDGYETQTRRDEDGTVEQKQNTHSGSQLMKVLPGLVLSFHRILLAQI